jgi:hypothetical protein
MKGMAQCTARTVRMSVSGTEQMRRHSEGNNCTCSIRNLPTLSCHSPESFWSRLRLWSCSGSSGSVTLNFLSSATNFCLRFLCLAAAAADADAASPPLDDLPLSASPPLPLGRGDFRKRCLEPPEPDPEAAAAPDDCCATPDPPRCCPWWSSSSIVGSESDPPSSALEKSSSSSE